MVFSFNRHLKSVWGDSFLFIVRCDVFKIRSRCQKIDSVSFLRFYFCICRDDHVACLLISELQTWHPTPVLLPGESHGWRSLVGCSPWGREESDTTEWLHFHTFLTLKFLNVVNRSECFYCCYLLSPSSLTLTCLGHLRFRLIRMRLPALNHLWLAEPATPYAWACAVCPWADTPSFCCLMPWCCSLHSCLQLILNSAV